MVETDDEGRPRLYWLAFKTQLIRAAPHHVRPNFEDISAGVDGLDAARRDVDGLRSRGVTRFLDLSRVNRRNIDDIDDDEEAMDDGDGPGDDGDDWFPMEPPTTRRRLSEDAGDDRPVLDLTGERSGLDSQPSALDFAGPHAAPEVEILDTSPRSRSSRAPSLAYSPTTMAGPNTPRIDTDEEEPNVEPPHPGTVPNSPGRDPRALQPDSLQPQHPQQPGHQEPPSVPRQPDSLQPSSTPSQPHQPPGHDLQLDPSMARLYEPAGPEDRFRLQRQRLDQQEAAIFGPIRRHRDQHQRPYDRDLPGDADGPTEGYGQAFDITGTQGEHLPDGWHCNDEGVFNLTEDPMDYWEVKAGCVIRHHRRPQRALFKLKDYMDTPVDPELLDGLRTTVLWKADSSFEIISDKEFDNKVIDKEWTSCTIFQITGKARREMGMFANLPAKKLGREAKTKMARQQKKVDKGGVNEQHLCAADRAKFQEAKRKELESFFHNQVWEFDTVDNAQAERTLTARVLTKWSKNPDGSPRAKARLIVRGYQDYDALSKGLDASSPTTSRTSRNFLLSLTAILGWNAWTSDIATAFLQGGYQSRKLWVKLPADCLQLLGAPPTTRMLLLKPVYGQLDAPRMWWIEAQRRLRELGLRQHPLDPCLFLAFEVDYAEEPCTDGTVFGEGRLCGAICLHVDDMLGAGSPTSATYAKLVEGLRASFNFREWKDGERLEYCGSVLEKVPGGGLKLHQEAYLGKVHPVTIQKGAGPNTDLTAKEITQLRGLCGALQWPAVQSAPHLQASTSITSGMVNNGKVSTITELNRTLKFAKENADVGLQFMPLGDIKNLRLVTMFDASFSARPDGSSQGGYMVMLVPEHTLTNTEDWFHLLEWRSLKLPRVARSSLAAEAQAAASAADATDFICKFYSYLENPNRKLGDLLGQESSLRPVLVTDAKALYDSYHRESVASSVTDRRIALEIRVIKELVMELKGELRWVSSERQWADGLTKLSARQLLAGRLRHGRVGFYWDPSYVAAKKKTAAERQQNMDAHAAPPPKRLRKIDEDVMEEEAEPGETYETVDENMPNETFETEDEDMPTETYENVDENLPTEAYAYMVYTNDMLDYVDVAFSKSKDMMENSEAILNGMRYYTTDILSQTGILPNLLSLLAYIVFWKMFLGLLLLAAMAYLVQKYVNHKMEKSYQAGFQAARDEAYHEVQQSRGLAIVMGGMEDTYVRVREQYREFARRRRILEDADVQRDAAIPVCRRALLEAVEHADICPMGNLIWEMDGTWHSQPQCADVPAYRAGAPRYGTPGSPVTVLRPCTTCSSGIPTPHIPDRHGTTLLRELEAWIIDQGTNAWPLTGPYADGA